MSDDAVRDPSAPDPAYAQLLGVRKFFATPQVWVCITDHYSEPAHAQIRCPICGALMELAK